MKQSTKYSAALVAVSAMFAAFLVGGKTALAVLPNIEVVTLLISLCAYVWGLAVVLPAVNVFIAIDMAIWGVNTWIIYYFIHWNIVALVFWLLSKAKLRNKVVEAVVATICAVVLTVCFGALTTAVDTLVGFTGRGFFVDAENFWYRFGVMYSAGVAFFVTHIVCNAVLFPVAFVPLVMLNKKVKMRLAPCE